LGNASEEAVGRSDGAWRVARRARYSQSYELEADVVGAFIAARAGYDPELGARVFTRPVLAGGGGLLSTHPASTRGKPPSPSRRRRFGASKRPG
jgi:predicted Zn-dependent protease